jgi:hypothetical protein
VRPREGRYLMTCANNSTWSAPATCVDEVYQHLLKVNMLTLESVEQGI